MFQYSSTLLGNFVSILLIGAIFLSFGLHAVQVKHVHYGENGSGHTHNHDQQNNAPNLDIALHANDKKMLFLVVIFFAHNLRPDALSVVYRLLSLASSYFFTAKKKYSLGLRVYSYLVLFFKKGVVHPKTF